MWRSVLTWVEVPLAVELTLASYLKLEFIHSSALPTPSDGQGPLQMHM